jgi:hypothetical protein
LEPVGPVPPSLTPHGEAARVLLFLPSVGAMASSCRILPSVTVEKPAREKRRRTTTVKVEERARSSAAPVVAPVDADSRRRARERAGGDD